MAKEVENAAVGWLTVNVVVEVDQEERDVGVEDATVRGELGFVMKALMVFFSSTSVFGEQLWHHAAKPSSTSTVLSVVVVDHLIRTASR